MNHSGILNRSNRQKIFDSSNHPETPERWRTRPTVSILATVAVLAIASGGGCSTSTIRVEAIADPVRLVADRHDAYIQADDTLSDLERETYLRTTSLLRQVIEEAEK